MTFYREGDRVNLDIASEDYDKLMTLFRDLLAVVADSGDMALCYRTCHWLNQMNRTNDKFTMYEIPEEFREPR